MAWTKFQLCAIRHNQRHRRNRQFCIKINDGGSALHKLACCSRPSNLAESTNNLRMFWADSIAASGVVWSSIWVRSTLKDDSGKNRTAKMLAANVIVRTARDILLKMFVYELNNLSCTKRWTWMIASRLPISRMSHTCDREKTHGRHLPLPVSRRNQRHPKCLKHFNCFVDDATDTG